MIIKTLSDTDSYAHELATRLTVGSVVSLSGPLGVGKTSLIKALCKELGVEQEVTSPSFVLMNRYQGRVPIFHFDLYRLEEMEEVYELGLQECMEQGVCFIEWPELVEDLLPAEAIRLKMNFKKENVRQINEEIDAK